MSWFNFKKKSCDGEAEEKKTKNYLYNKKKESILEEKSPQEQGFSCIKIDERLTKANEVLERVQQMLEKSNESIEKSEVENSAIREKLKENQDALDALNEQEACLKKNIKPYYTINYNSRTKGAGPDEFKGIPRQIDEPEVKSLNS